MILTEVNDLSDANQLMLRHRVQNVDAMGIVRAALYAGPHLNIQIAAIQIIGGDAIAIVGQPARREWLARLELKANRLGEFALWNALIAGHFNVIDKRGGSLFDGE